MTRERSPWSPGGRAILYLVVFDLESHHIQSGDNPVGREVEVLTLGDLVLLNLLLREGTQLMVRCVLNKL